MFVPVNLLPGAIAELFAEVSDSRVLTLADRYGLMAAMFDESLTEEEQRAVNRVLRSVLRGDVQLVDDLSTVGYSLSEQSRLVCSGVCMN